MAESTVYRRMKAIVKEELERENYRVLEEPLAPPSGRISWCAYRPDLLGYRLESGEEGLVIVECETHPSMRRFGMKNYASLKFQPFLFLNGSVRRILAVPQGKLAAVDVNLRKEWEIWILGSVRPVCRIGLLESSSPFTS